MLRKMLGMLALGMMLLAGGCSNDDVSNISGVWSMNANNYLFDLVINQSGSAISGTMIATGHTEANTDITGSIDSNDTITFMRLRADKTNWQSYTGTLAANGLTMSGTFTSLGLKGSWLWAATKK